MATLTADQAASTYPVSTHGFAGNLKVAHGTYDLSAALAGSDVIQMVRVPAGAKVVDVVLATDDLDTGGTAAIVLDVGDGDDPDRYIDGSTAGQAGGTERMNVATGVDYEYAAADTIDVTVATAPATGATSGTVSLAVFYYI